MGQPTKGVVDYVATLKRAATEQSGDLVGFLLEELPYVWRDAYCEMTSRQTNIVRWRYSSFEYLFHDHASLEATGAVPLDPNAEARLIAALGLSHPREKTRDDYRLKGWIGATERTFGSGWDKGHFIAHSIGGAVDGLEANLFVQRRDLNRGWSEAGKRFRDMEQYCCLRPRTLCFSRPLYVDETARPAQVEFGVLKENRELWVECFDNR